MKSNKQKIEEKKRNNFLISIGAVIVIGIVVFLKLQTQPVEPITLPENSKINYADLININSNQAVQRNNNAFKQFEMKLDLALKEYNNGLEDSAKNAAENAATYKSACAIVYYLAYDKIKTTNTTEIFLQEKINPVINPLVKTLTDSINSSIEKLNYELQSSTMILAKDLAVIGSGILTNNYIINTVDLTHVGFQKTLRNFGINFSTVGIFGTFDLLALFKTQFGKTVWKKLAGVAARMFARQVTTTTASAIAPLADGPLPFGDALAIGGAVWTAYDVYSSKKSFEKELNTSIKNILKKIRYETKEQAINHSNNLIKEYQKLQTKMGNEILNQIIQN